MTIVSCSLADSTSDSCGVDLSVWQTLVNVLGKVFLDNFFQITFKQNKHCFQYINRIPIGWWLVSTFKEEEVYYDPDGEYLILSAELDETDCEPKCFDDRSRRDDGTTYCVSMVD
eukprot:gnl/Carplike_NY0171/27544_a54088_70.p1 GENE.gnl/Carplike_NY0171/27544_a54088_70~~gnl/Carplike_NY0171/27544_a54088_70.p1  ORF type:complete len:115 (-),score=20.97 gnl/Carplike_NY0171/27544_a54088_70:180-524(-)